ncbi:MAG TPA: DEDD exonuclease domain-containing protein [Acidimicrobiales bacterium]|nr:DEDD exonuclease domain-containing protein [Acidimicrobiales bacterium]
MQASFDDLSTPLAQVTFVVVDLETTGGSPATDAITEVGAVKLRGGECLGTFATLVNPGVAIPPSITYLTGITEWMVAPAPPIEGVLAALLEFIGDAVVVGHNVGFDVRFLDAACAATGRPRLANRIVDTCALARRLVREEVPDCKLGTLAAHLRLDHTPCHRALDDALATGDLLHAMLERAAGLGVLGLDDLLALPTVRGHAQAGKLALTARLPRSPGVYLFRNAAGRVIYVGKAVDLRRRVRSYFTGGGDDRRKASAMLRELAAIEHQVCANDLEARVREIRLIHALAPRYNAEAKHWKRYVYVKLTLAERYPRLAVVRTTPDDGGLYLGPVGSARAARVVVEAVESVLPLRRCATRVPRGGPTRGWPCTPAQLGVAACPCSGGAPAYDATVAAALEALRHQPRRLLDPLEARMHALAEGERFEEAATARDRAAALSRVLTRQARLHALRAAGRLVVTVAGEGGAVIDAGRLVTAWGPEGASPAGPPAPAAVAPSRPTDPIGRDEVDEMACVARWLDGHAGQLRLIDAGHGWAWPAWRADPPTRRPRSSPFA